MSSKVIISSGSDRRLADWLEQNGCDVEPFRTHGIVSGPLSAHPDMFMCKMGVSADAEVIVVRTALEDAMLADGLEGYSEYRDKVRWRLVPFVW